MRLLLTASLACLVACFAVTGCGSTSSPQGDADMAVTSGANDLSSPVTMMDLAMSGPGPDIAGPRPDGAPTVTCADGYACNNNCGSDQKCGQACLDSITTANGQKLFLAVQKCFSMQVVGMCASKCGTPTPDCGACLYLACMSDLSACMQDM